jgi:glycosyltransferase involved in cell wall biosynthesis
MKRIAIVVPCYNEEDALRLFYDEVRKHFVPGYDFYLLFVDDGSKDGTLQTIKEISLQDQKVLYLSFSRNFGKETAIYAGLSAAKEIDADAAILIDADLQDPPGLIPEMLALYEAGYKHVYTKHRSRKGEPFLKKFFARSFYIIYGLFTKNRNIARGARDFSLLDRDVIEAFLKIKDYRRFTKGIFAWLGFQSKCLEFDYVPRAAGKTKWSFKKLFRYAILGIKQFSHFYLLIPNILIILCLLLFGFEIIHGIREGFNHLALRMEILALLILIGIKYLMRLLYDIRDQTLGRPLYLTKETNVEVRNHEETL